MVSIHSYEYSVFIHALGIPTSTSRAQRMHRHRDGGELLTSGRRESEIYRIYRIYRSSAGRTVRVVPVLYPVLECSL